MAVSASLTSLMPSSSPVASSLGGMSFSFLASLIALLLTVLSAFFEDFHDTLHGSTF